MSAPAAYPQSNNSPYHHILPEGASVAAHYDLTPTAVQRMQQQQVERQLGTRVSVEQRLSSAFDQTRLFADRPPSDYFVLNQQRQQQQQQQSDFSPSLNRTPPRQHYHQSTALLLHGNLVSSPFSSDNPFAAEAMHLRLLEQQRMEEAAAAAAMMTTSMPPESTAPAGRFDFSLDAQIRSSSPTVLAGRTVANEVAATMQATTRSPPHSNNASASAVSRLPDDFVNSPHNRQFLQSIGAARMAPVPRAMTAEQTAAKALMLGFALLTRDCERLAGEFHILKQAEYEVVWEEATHDSERKMRAAATAVAERAPIVPLAPLGAR